MTTPGAPFDLRDRLGRGDLSAPLADAVARGRTAAAAGEGRAEANARMQRIRQAAVRAPDVQAVRSPASANLARLLGRTMRALRDERRALRAAERRSALAVAGWSLLLLLRRLIVVTAVVGALVAGAYLAQRAFEVPPDPQPAPAATP